MGKRERPEDEEFARTWLVRAVESELKVNLPRLLRQRYWGLPPSQRWSTNRLGYELGISGSTVARYLRQLGWSRMQAADRAWEQGLLPEEPYERMESSQQEAG